jgi:uncharacterized protein YjcR
LDTRWRRRDANGRFASEVWADPEAVRVDYEAGLLTINEVAIKHAISASKLHRWVVQYGWTPRAPHRIDPNDLIMRMFSALDAQMRDLETTMKDADGSHAGMLAKLVTTLDKLIEIKDAEARKGRKRSQASKEVTELRAKIAERIAELNVA